MLQSKNEIIQQIEDLGANEPLLQLINKLDIQLQGIQSGSSQRQKLLNIDVA